MFSQIDPSQLQPSQLAYGTTFLAAMLILAMASFFAIVAALAWRAFDVIANNTSAITCLTGHLERCPCFDRRDPAPVAAPNGRLPSAAVPAIS
jgi:hypothetical protein